jgi:hypothetical protein
MARKRNKLGRAAKTARNLAVADAAIALMRQGSSSHRRRGAKALLLGGAAAAIAAGALLKRDKVAGLLPSRTSDEPQSTGGWTPAPATGPSNYDAPGPVANTATPVPAPEPQSPPAVDEAA